jgi:cytochrome oxidase Cu insertion factor (SCO1/SenC/PrrC family)
MAATIEARSALQATASLEARFALQAAASLETRPSPVPAPAAAVPAAEMRSSYTRQAARYDVPDVTLVDADGRRVPLKPRLEGGKPVVLDFFYATCSTVCPVLSAGFVHVQQQLGVDTQAVQLVSIAIDPEHDTPAELRGYRSRYGARPGWELLTGSRSDVERVLRAFDALAADKMAHWPLTFLKRPGAAEWVRLEGLISGPELYEELRRVRDAAQPGSEGLRPTGERMYREGLLPSGLPMMVRIPGDVEVDGRLFSCSSCHLRSGLGSTEGRVIVRPITGARLFRPLFRADLREIPADRADPAWVRREALRPAYTAETLARAIRDGIDPAGRALDPVMPRYRLSDRDMAALIDHLEHLSAQPSPGIDGSTLRLATVITDDVPAERRDAMLLPLEASVRAWNTQPRRQATRSRQNTFYMIDMYAGYRTLTLDRWVLTGTSETWPAQLESAYQRRPVFALVGGITTGEWTPIHRFCDAHRLPCLLPVTDLPAPDAAGGFTLYFSRGLALEAESAASFLRGVRPAPGGVLQVYRTSPQGLALAQRFRRTWIDAGGPLPAEIALPPGGPLDVDGVIERVARSAPSVLVLWLDRADLAAVRAILRAMPPGVGALLSGGLLEDAVETLPGTDHAATRDSRPGADRAATRDALPDADRADTWITWPFALPKDEAARRAVATRWLAARGIEARDRRVQARMYFLGGLLAGLLTQLRDNPYRDYLLDLIDMMPDDTTTLSVYPRVSFGPGQRYLAKGCYVLAATGGAGAGWEVVRDWAEYGAGP